jgi:hypothetical protein
MYHSIVLRTASATVSRIPTSEIPRVSELTLRQDPALTDACGTSRKTFRKAERNQYISQ